MGWDNTAMLGPHSYLQSPLSNGCPWMSVIGCAGCDCRAAAAEYIQLNSLSSKFELIHRYVVLKNIDLQVDTFLNLSELS